MELKPIDCKRDERMKEKPKKKNEEISLNASQESKSGRKGERERARSIV